jgi:hypothetical protein
MSKIILSIILLFVPILCHAASKVATMGTPNAVGTYAMEAFDDRTIVVADDASLNVNGTFGADEISLDTSYVDDVHQEGNIHWDVDDKTAVIDMSVEGVHLQVGQELHVYCTNKSGAQLTNGTVVYQNGVQGFRPKIYKAQSNAKATSSPIGVLTHDVADNGNAYVTTFGLVRGLNTASFADGAPVWLSASVAGAFTSTEPALPNRAIYVGRVLKSHVSEGILLVDIIDSHSVVDNIEVDGNLYMGSATTDGSWRFSITGQSSLEFQRRESGVWVMKGRVEP